MTAALYVTDANGWLTYYNEASVALWGRRPVIGKDRWCGSWRLYETDGTSVPLDQCGMAVALREGRAVEGVQGLMERPDGTRVLTVGHSTPLRDPAGTIIGGTNITLVVDLPSEPEQDAPIAPNGSH